MSVPTPYVPSIIVDNVIAALGAFLTPFVGSAQIIRGQQNRVAPPSSVAEFVKLTEIFEDDLETPVTGRISQGQINFTTPTKIDIQVDFYGPSAGDWCKAVKTVYRTPYTVSQFPAGISPLYCSEARQLPLTNAEDQYEARWTVTASLQYNPTVYLPLQSATALKMNLVEDLL